MTPETFDELIGLLHTVDHAWRNAIDRRLRPLGFSRSTWRILAVLERRKEIAQGRLADLLALEGPTVVRMIDRLERDGIVERHADPQDGRVRIIRLTANGKRAVKPIRGIIGEFRSDVFAEMSDPDVAAAITVLDELRRVVRSVEERQKLTDLLGHDRG